MSDKFDIYQVHEKFTESLIDQDDVLLMKYLEGYSEIYKFLTLMGNVFNFVASDVKSKMDILHELLQDPTISNNFETIKSMIDYEMTQELLNKKDYVSGSRTLLRLHRGLDFIRLFLKRLSEIENHEKTATICQNSYYETLAPYHPWYIRKGATVAMSVAMPTREQLLRRVCGSEEQIQRSINILPDMLDATTEVYNRIENLYTINDLHSLP